VGVEVEVGDVMRLACVRFSSTSFIKTDNPKGRGVFRVVVVGVDPMRPWEM